MMVLEPVRLTDAMLISTSLPEADHPEWSSGVTYAVGAKVIKAATHRIYESLIASNIGNVPAASASFQWLDIGPTNRWAAFDEALGTFSTATGSLSFTLAPGLADTVAILGASAATVRVQAVLSGITLYDETRDATADVLLFSDIPAAADAQILIDLAGPDAVAVEAVLAGLMHDLGQTETSPTIGVTDYSKRSTDEFGITTVIKRSWAKTLTLRSLIDTDEVDAVQVLIARLRVVPALWVGEAGYDSLTAYGFYKSFSIDLALPTISYCSFSIEGLAA